jgi:hypothetical protein
MTQITLKPKNNDWIAIKDTPPPVGERVTFMRLIGDWGRRLPDGTYRMEITLPDEPFAFTHWKQWEK